MGAWAVDINEITKDTRAAYSRMAQKYHELFHDEMNQKEFDRIILDSFARYFDEASSLCDAGCGPSGHITRYLYDKGLKILGIDISDRCIGIAGKQNPEMEFKVMDMTCLGLPDKSLDGIVSFYSILHTPKEHQNLIFREFNRVLKKGGKALVVVKKGEDEGYIHEMLGEEVKIYFTNFMENEIEGLFKENGFKINYIVTRQPYEFEIEVPRIYTAAEKL